MPPYVTPIVHRRSTSTSSTGGFGRPQSYNLSRTAVRSAAATPLNIYNHNSADMPHLPTTNSLAQMEEEYQKRLNISAASKYNADGQQLASDMRSMKEKKLSQSASNNLSSTLDQFNLRNSNHTRQLSQSRPSTGEMIIPINTNSYYVAQEQGKILQKSAEIPCLKG